MDEAFEVSRAVHDGHWLYIRNYMPHLSWMQPEGYSDAALMRREMFQLAAQGKLNAAQMTYAAPTKPLEELYDSAADPHNIHNLAAAPEHRAVLERMREQVHQWIIETRDVGFLPEPDVVAVTGGKPAYDWARQPGAYPLERILAAADLVGRPEALEKQIALLGDSDRGVRYWAAVGLTAQGSAGRRGAGRRCSRRWTILRRASASRPPARWRRWATPSGRSRSWSPRCRATTGLP